MDRFHKRTLSRITIHGTNAINKTGIGKLTFHHYRTINDIANKALWSAQPVIQM